MLTSFYKNRTLAFRSRASIFFPLAAVSILFCLKNICTRYLGARLCVGDWCCFWKAATFLLSLASVCASWWNGFFRLPRFMCAWGVDFDWFLWRFRNDFQSSSNPRSIWPLRNVTYVNLLYSLLCAWLMPIDVTVPLSVVETPNAHVLVLDDIWSSESERLFVFYTRSAYSLWINVAVASMAHTGEIWTFTRKCHRQCLSW